MSDRVLKDEEFSFGEAAGPLSGLSSVAGATRDPSADPLDPPLEERPLIYVAGYYSASPAHGLANAMAAFQPLVDAGWLPLVPHVSFLADVLAPNPPAFWYAYDLALLARCDAMYVCPDALTATSTGVNEEIRFAMKHDIPIFDEIVPASERYDW